MAIMTKPVQSNCYCTICTASAFTRCQLESRQDECLTKLILGVLQDFERIRVLHGCSVESMDLWLSDVFRCVLNSPQVCQLWPSAEA